MMIQIVLTVILALLVAQIVAQPLFTKFLKLAGFLLVASGMMFVFKPELANSVAHALGVGRGADLFMYLSISGGSVILFRMYLRIRQLEIHQIELVRQLAIQQFYLERGTEAPRQ